MKVRFVLTPSGQIKVTVKVSALNTISQYLLAACCLALGENISNFQTY